MNRDKQEPKKWTSQSARAKVIFTQPYPIGTHSQLESIPLTSASKYVILQCVYTHWLHLHWKHCLSVRVFVCVCVNRGTICTGFVVSKGNKHFHHVVVPFRFKMISVLLRSIPRHQRDWWYKHPIPSPPNPNYTSGKAKAMGSACNLLRHNHSHA